MQHISYKEQLIIKKQIVQNNIKKYAQLDVPVEDTIACKYEYNYRNHITFDMLGSLNDEDIDNLEMNNDADINRFRKAIAGLKRVSITFY